MAVPAAAAAAAALPWGRGGRAGGRRGSSLPRPRLRKHRRCLLFLLSAQTASGRYPLPHTCSVGAIGTHSATGLRVPSLTSRSGQDEGPPKPAEEGSSLLCCSFWCRGRSLGSLGLGTLHCSRSLQCRRAFSRVCVPKCPSSYKDTSPQVGPAFTEYNVVVTDPAPSLKSLCPARPHPREPAVGARACLWESRLAPRQEAGGIFSRVRESKVPTDMRTADREMACL